MNKLILFEKHERLRMSFIAGALAAIVLVTTLTRLILGWYSFAAIAISITSFFFFVVSWFLFRAGHDRLANHVLVITGTTSTLGWVLNDGGMGIDFMVWLPFIPFLITLLTNYIVSIGYTIVIVLGIAYLSIGSNFSSFEQFSVALAVVFGCGIGIILEKVRLKYERKIAQMATSHPLTGLPSRVVFDVLLDQAAGQFNRDGIHFSLIFIDVDGLKGVNDAFGHVAGDALLQEVGRRLSAVVRESESVFHISGDEFVIIAGEQSDLEPIKTRVRGIGGTFAYLDFRIPLSVSVGGAQGTADSENSLIAADSDMYLDKRSNSNERK